MGRKTLLAGIVIGLLLAAAGIVWAGSLLDPATPPGATSSYTLESIYQRLIAGTAGAQSTFAEPLAGPAGTMHTLDEIMGAAPAVDDTNGATAAEVLAGKTFWSLRSSAWGLQTGSAVPGSTYNAGVPKTGQTWNNGRREDGELQKGVPWPSPRFTDNLDGTVTDNLTGLIWLQDADCFGWKTWPLALKAVNNLQSPDCGLSDGSVAGLDWRLPNVREMYSLVDYGRTSPALPSPNPFSNPQSFCYWTSTLGPTDPVAYDKAICVHLAYGRVEEDQLMTDTALVWPVKGGP